MIRKKGGVSVSLSYSPPTTTPTSGGLLGGQVKLEIGFIWSVLMCFLSIW